MAVGLFMRLVALCLLRDEEMVKVVDVCCGIVCCT